MISAFSERLDSAQKNYTITERELLAIVKSCEHYKHYLLGCKFELKTDHKALSYLQTCKDPTSRLLRWALTLQQFDMDIQYIKGDDNVADCLSRIGQIANIKSEQPFNQQQISEILKEYHFKSGHGSAATMKFLIKPKYKWNTMFKDIDKHIENCVICQKSSPERQNTKFKVIETTYPNELWVCDLIGRIPVSDGTNLFIFIAIDHYTKWIETKIIKSKTATEIIEAINTLIINKHGIPEKILSDSGLEFENKNVKLFTDNKGIKWISGSPYHHNTCGAVERAIQTFMNKLKRLTEFEKKSISQWTQQATAAYNISFNRSIDSSPFILKYGRHPVMKVDKLLKIEIPNCPPLQDIYEIRNKHWVSYSKKDIQEGIKSVPNDFKVGDKVLIYHEPLKGKLSSNWTTGFIILEKSSEDSYIVSNGKSTMRLNKKHLKHDKTLSEGDVVSPPT